MMQFLKVRVNDSLLQIEEIVKIYANSMYLDGHVRWVLYFG